MGNHDEIKNRLIKISNVIGFLGIILTSILILLKIYEIFKGTDIIRETFLSNILIFTFFIIILFVIPIIALILRKRWPHFYEIIVWTILFFIIGTTFFGVPIVKKISRSETKKYFANITAGQFQRLLNDKLLNVELYDDVRYLKTYIDLLDKSDYITLHKSYEILKMTAFLGLYQDHVQR